MKNLEKYRELLQNKKFKYLLLAFLIVLPFEILSFFSTHLPKWVELPLFITLIIIFGRAVFTSGIRSLLHLRFSDINLLMTIAIAGAVYLQEWEEAVIIVVLFALGNALEDFGIEQSQSALKELVDNTPKTAQVKGKTGKTSVKEIGIGDVIIVKPGDQIPLDGKVIMGMSLVDEATITGEPLPKNKHEGDFVYAGTINGNGYMEIQVTKTAEDSTLSKIIDLTYSSAEKKSHSQKFIEKFASYYTPFVIVAAFLLVLVPVGFLGEPFTPWFTQSLTLLIIACPCALVISTPITIFSAIGNATKKGVIIKGGRFVEELGKIRAIAFDKTRTLTKGEPVVSDIVPFNGFTQMDVLACASGIESFSEHPLALSVIEEAKKHNLNPHQFTKFEAVSGKGLRGDCLVCTDKHHCMGNIKFITEEHAVEDEVIQQVEAFEKQGKTTVIMSDNKKVTGVIGITDEIREDSKLMINALTRMKIKPVILTGDNESSAFFVAEQIGIKQVRAELLPDQKVAELSKLISQYKHVGMVGDGVNDAPSLVTAPVGIAMGAIGSDVAIENADVALMNNNMTLIPFLVELGRKSVQKIRYNTATAIGVKLLFLSLALAGKSSLVLAIFADVGVTVLVVVNSLRLFNFGQKKV
ncbi:MAG: cadmium-translocating P-type ATPase [Patescibacteria group bacterium]|nr:cadmium-translocating P-type ATPase [Patescibacteria group bacterium]MCL5095780.1 cadmium-translocating P-type ATPase [Patescibacteria group bacterium]